jgi:ferredoxin-NADP reductase
MIKPQEFTAKLEEKVVHNDKFIQLSFELVEPFQMQFAAGQYVSVKVAADGTRRSYSICSRPDIDHGFELLVELIPNGVGSQFFDQLEYGETVSLLAPLGRFNIEPQPVDELVFVATGSGVTPFRSMILDQLQLQQDSRPMTLFWGLRHVDYLFWQDEFMELAENFANFTFHPVISQPVPDWLLCRGRVTDCLSVHQLPENAAYYLCGSSQMIDDVSQLLIKKEVAQDNIHFEKFF